MILTIYNFIYQYLSSLTYRYWKFYWIDYWHSHQAKHQDLIVTWDYYESICRQILNIGRKPQVYNFENITKLFFLMHQDYNRIIVAKTKATIFIILTWILSLLVSYFLLSYFLLSYFLISYSPVPMYAITVLYTITVCLVHFSYVKYQVLPLINIECTQIDWKVQVLLAKPRTLESNSENYILLLKAIIEMHPQRHKPKTTLCTYLMYLF